MDKPAREAVEGEQLKVIVGSIPLDDKEDNPVKRNILEILNKKYGIIEEDFITAEFEVVPAIKARNAGLDNSMIIAHGQDDRICTYSTLNAIFNIEKPSRTAVALFVDKEEIGSYGSTAMTSQFFENTVLELLNIKDKANLISLKRSLQNSKVLSADLTSCKYSALASFDPPLPPLPVYFVRATPHPNCAELSISETSLISNPSISFA